MQRQDSDPPTPAKAQRKKPENKDPYITSITAQISDDSNVPDEPEEDEVKLTLPSDKFHQNSRNRNVSSPATPVTTIPNGPHPQQKSRQQRAQTSAVDPKPSRTVTPKRRPPRPWPPVKPSSPHSDSDNEVPVVTPGNNFGRDKLRSTISKFNQFQQDNDQLPEKSNSSLDKPRALTIGYADVGSVGQEERGPNPLFAMQNHTEDFSK